MNIIVDHVTPDVACIRLKGRLDMRGSGEIDLRFTALTATDDRPVIIDMRGVDLIASIGIRLLLTCAKAKKMRGGKMALAGLQPFVKESLETAGIISLIPVYSDETTALNALAKA